MPIGRRYFICSSTLMSSYGDLFIGFKAAVCGIFKTTFVNSVESQERDRHSKSVERKREKMRTKTCNSDSFNMSQGNARGYVVKKIRLICSTSHVRQALAHDEVLQCVTCSPEAEECDAFSSYRNLVKCRPACRASGG